MATLRSAIGGGAGKAYRPYQAAFDRTPDVEGLGCWIAQIDTGAKLFDIATGFIESDEFKALYGQAPSNADYTQALYLNVLDGETTRQQMLVDFSESAGNRENVIAVIGNGFDYVPWG